MKKAIVRFIQLILVLIILYSAYKIGSYYYGRYKAEKEFDSYADMVTQAVDDIDSEDDKDDKEEKTGDKKPKKKNSLDIFSLMTMEDFKKHKTLYDKVAIDSLMKFKEKNEDIVSFINMPGLSVRYPVVFRDNDFYLRRNLQGEYSWAGSIFLEETNNPNFSDMNTVIYGHNMSNSYIQAAEMFDPIINFSDADYVNSRDEHYIDIFTMEGVERYKIFSAYFVDAAADYRTSNMDPSYWSEYQEILRQRSIFDYGDVKFTQESKIITLSTCDNVNDDGRFTVHAIRMDI